IDLDRGIAAMGRAVALGAGIDDELLHLRTELLATASRLLYHAWSDADLRTCLAARATLVRREPGGLPAYHRVIFAHVLVLEGHYDEALAELDAGVVNEPRSQMARIFALSGKMPALLLSGRLSGLLALLREGGALAAKNGNDPWLFTFREAWL